MGEMVPVLALLAGSGAWERAQEVLALMNPRTRKAYGGAFRRYCGWCRREGLEALDKGSFDGWLRHLGRQDVSRGTLDVCYHGVVKVLRLLGVEAEDRWSRELKAGYRKRLRLPGGSRAMTGEELVRLVGASEGAMRFLLVLGYGGGLRLSELLGLRWEDVREVDGGLSVFLRSSKGDRGNEGVTVWVGDYLGLVVCGIPRGATGRVWASGETMFRRCFRALTVRAGLCGLTPHSIRSGCATRAVSGGVGAIVLSRHLRHSSVSTTARYYRDAEGRETGRAVCAALSRGVE